MGGAFYYCYIFSVLGLDVSAAFAFDFTTTCFVALVGGQNSVERGRLLGSTSFFERSVTAVCAKTTTKLLFLLVRPARGNDDEKNVHEME